MDPVTAGVLLAGAGSVWGAFNQNNANNANQSAQQQAINNQLSNQQMIKQLAMPYLQNGQNPYAAQLMSMLGMGGTIASPQQAAPIAGHLFGGGLSGILNQLQPSGLISAPTGTGPHNYGGGGVGPGGALMPSRGMMTAQGGASFSRMPSDVSSGMGIGEPHSEVGAPAFTWDTSGLTPTDVNLGGQLPAGGSPTLPSSLGTPGGTGPSFRPPTDLLAQLYNPSTYGAQGYNPAQIGGAQLNMAGIPQVLQQQIMASLLSPAGVPGVGAQSVYGSQVYGQQVNPALFNAGMFGGITPQQAGTSQINASQMNPSLMNLGAIPQIGGGSVFAPQIDLGLATGSQGFNAGQDALSQMMRSNAGAGAFDTSGMFKALAPLDQQTIDQQVAQLQGSSGSLGQRFGTASADREALMRGNFANQIAARNAGIQQSSYESAASRALQAAGLQQGSAQALQSGALQQSGLLGQLATSNAGMGMQAQLANQQAGLQAGQANQGAMLQALLANQQMGQQAGLVNQSTQLTAQQANAANQLAASQSNQAAGLQGQTTSQDILLRALMANQGAAMQGQLANQQTGLAAQQTTAQQALQAQLANQQTGLQAGTTNQAALIQMLMANQGAQQQTSLANQQAGMQAGQLNQAALMQALMGNQSASLQAQLANQASQNAAGQFGAQAQNTAGQYNAGAYNTAGQFNAGQATQAGQFNAGQQQAWNQFMSGILGQASGMQNQQQGLNNQLLSIIAGLPQAGFAQQQPSAMPGALGDIGSLMMLLPFLRGMQGGQSPGYTVPPNYIPGG